MANSTTANQPQPKPPPAAFDEAVATVCARNLHQCLWLPETATHGKLRVTFSTTSNFSNTDLPVVFFCPPMLGSRWASLTFGHTAAESGVRLISVDRPGMGGSTPVPLNMRVKVWLEMVAAVLQRLNVQHIDLLLSHSAGTIYSLNTLYTHRNFLNPAGASVVFLAPWVHNEHSEVFLTNMVAKLPNGVIDQWHNLNRFINTKVIPVTSLSGGVITSFTNLFQSSSTGENSDKTTVTERYGTSEAVGNEIENLRDKYFFVEDSTSANEDVKLCSKKGDPGDWGVCEDYKQCVQMLIEQERRREESEPASKESAKLKVHVYFAESDMMIGKIGQKYFEECWRQAGVDEFFDFESVELPGTDHDSTVLDLRKGGLRTAFDLVGKGGERK